MWVRGNWSACCAPWFKAGCVVASTASHSLEPPWGNWYWAGGLGSGSAKFLSIPGSSDRFWFGEASSQKDQCQLGPSTYLPSSYYTWDEANHLNNFIKSYFPLYFFDFLYYIWHSFCHFLLRLAKSACTLSAWTILLGISPACCSSIAWSRDFVLSCSMILGTTTFPTFCLLPTITLPLPNLSSTLKAFLVPPMHKRPD